MRNKALFAAILAAMLSAPSPLALAQTNDGASQGATNVYLKLQEMQYEIRDLRGMVEELSHEVQRLRQRQIDDYQDLDSRLSGVPATPSASGAASLPAGFDPLMDAASAGAGGQAASNPLLEGSTSSGSEGSGRGGSSNEGFANGGFSGEGAFGAGSTGEGSTGEGSTGEESELDSYSAAYDLLKQRRIDDSISAFLAHLESYPRGQYAANAHYWLGEIHLLQNDLSAAETSFATVVNDFADDRKVPDALFKLGRVYHLQGQNDKARAALTRVAATNTSAAALARAYLQDNF